MKQTITESYFMDAFQFRPDNFTYEGLKALFDYLESFEEATGEEMELDVVAVCCDFTEYESIKDFQANYGDNYATIEDIEDMTSVITIDDERFITQNF